MRILVILVIAASVSSRLAAQEPASLPTDAIDAAIARGQKAKQCNIAVKSAGKFGSTVGFAVALRGPLNQIECAAASAAARYQTYTRDSASGITPDLLTIRVEPDGPVFANRRWNVTGAVKHIVIMEGDGRAGATAIQPDSVELFPVSWSNAAGGKFESGGAIARFRLSKLPLGEFTVVVVSEEEERRTKVGQKDRAKIQ